MTATYLLAAGTVDQEIYDVVQSKRSVVNAATEGGEAGKVDMARTLVGKYVQLGLDKTG